jgi:UDP-N-acetylglucosamine 1-carboxyvinyltransferase
MPERPKSVDVVTLPYPGFPTDLQPHWIALASVSDGAAMVTENVYDSRFTFIHELVRLGADIRTDGHHAVVRGLDTLSGAPVRAPDIRAGAGLVIAGLVADGVTTVTDIHHIDRGYEALEGALSSLGADVARTDEPDIFGG